MANNRMYLVNTRTGDKVFIGKYYPSTGWYVFDADNFAARVSEAFHRSDFGGLSYEEASQKNIPSSGGLLGDTNWCIKYEFAEGASNDEAAQTKINIVNAVSDAIET